jgi:hypothetical protein
VGDFVGGLKLCEIGLRENIVREQKFAALEGGIGADDFDLCLLEVGAGDGDIVTLKLSDNLTLVDVLAG